MQLPRQAATCWLPPRPGRQTAVLVERIIRKITDKEKPVDIDRLLIVTFTNAAATEMRERIGSALADALEADPHRIIFKGKWPCWTGRA